MNNEAGAGCAIERRGIAVGDWQLGDAVFVGIHVNDALAAMVD